MNKKAALAAAAFLLALSCSCSFPRGSEETDIPDLPEEEKIVFDISATKVNMQKTTLTSRIRIRDPFVLAYGGYYFMYGTALGSNGYYCVVSEDLKNWASGGKVCENDFGATADFWAPEVHYYNEKFYLFATYRSVLDGKEVRGTGIFAADSPLGEFKLISDGPATPHDRYGIDGTLFIDNDGMPWMVYCDEWVNSDLKNNGGMWAAPLKSDLSGFLESYEDERFVSERGIYLFSASDAAWTSGMVTDGPAFYRTESGSLIMFWSSGGKNGLYNTGYAVSESGDVTGPWKQSDKAIITNDAGHPMVFTDFEGNTIVAMHRPNGNSIETAKFFTLTEKNNEPSLEEILN